MTAQITPSYVVDVYRDVRSGVIISESLEERIPPEVKAQFIEAMRTDVANNVGGWSRKAMREGFEAMGFPADWIDEVLK